MKRPLNAMKLAAFSLMVATISTPVTAQKDADVRLNTPVVGSDTCASPEIAALGDSVYVAWSEKRSGRWDIYFNRSLDGGATWLPTDTRIDTDLPGVANSIEPQIAVARDAVYVIWVDGRNSQSDIYFNRSLDKGDSWLAEDVRLDTDLPGAALSLDPQIAVSVDSIFVTWTDDRNGAKDIYFNRSLDNGSSWLVDDVRLDTNQAGLTDSIKPMIAAYDGMVYVTWQDSRNILFLDAPQGDIQDIASLGVVDAAAAFVNADDIYFNRSLDSGATFMTSDLRLDTDTAGAAQSIDPQIAVVRDEVYVIWEDKRNGESDIYFNRSLNGGANWMFTDMRLDGGQPGAALSYRPRIASCGDCIAVIWLDARNGEHDVYFNHSFNSGATWLTNPVRVDTDAPGSAHSFRAEIVNFAGAVYVTWQDARNGGLTKEDIYFNRSLNHGADWLASDVRLNTDAPGTAHSMKPQLAVTGNSVYVTWQDNRMGSPLPFDICFNIPFGSLPYGEGTAGFMGYVPTLAGSDALNLGDVFTLRVKDGLGCAFGMLVVGGPGSQAALPFFDGTLFVDPVEYATPIILGGASGTPGEGEATLHVLIPLDSAFLGFNFNMQAAFIDATATHGFTLTNAVEAWIL
ncbi:MAG: sialidase family protein [Planctomycetota bacterium]